MKLGDAISVRAVYFRRRNADKKFWDIRAMTPRTGIYIGWRTLSNGVSWYEDEVGMVYEPREHFRAALVVFSERERPVFVPIAAANDA